MVVDQVASVVEAVSLEAESMGPGLLTMSMLFGCARLDVAEMHYCMATG